MRCVGAKASLHLRVGDPGSPTTTSILAIVKRGQRLLDYEEDPLSARVVVIEAGISAPSSTNSGGTVGLPLRGQSLPNPTDSLLLINGRHTLETSNGSYLKNNLQCIRM